MNKSLKRRSEYLFRGFKIFLMFFCLLFLLPKVGMATEIKIMGGNNPTVTNAQGVDVTNDQELDRYQYYNVTYQWSVPNGIQIHAGDTATFTVPNNVQVLYDTSFPVYDSNHNVVGTFTVKSGSDTGTLVFNNYFDEHHITQNIHGVLTFSGVGKHTYNHKGWVVNKSGWVNGEQKPVWDIVYNPDGKDLKNVIIKDQLEGPQTLDSQSIQIQYGTVDDNNQFHEEGIVSPDQYQLSTSDNGFQLKFDQLNTPIQIIYNTNVKENNSTGSINNGVETSDSQFGVQQDTASIQVSGSGSASGNTSSSESTTPSTSSSTEETTSSNESTTSSTSSSTEETTSSNESTTPSTSSSTEETTSSNESTTPSTSSSTEETTSSNESTTSSTSSSTEETTSSNESTTSSTSSSTEETTSSNESTTSSTSSSTEETTSSSESTTPSAELFTEKNNNIITTPYNNHSSNTTSKNSPSKSDIKEVFLPKTGNQSNKMMMIIGMLLILLVIMIGVYYFKNRNKK